MCYCNERLINKELAKELEDLPPGFCGKCQFCGKPGHTRAHPSSPYTGSWCEDHPPESALPLDRIFQAGIMFSVLSLLIYTVWISL